MRVTNDNNKVEKQETQGQSQKSIKALINNDIIKKKFTEILGKKSQGFLVSVLNTVNSNKQLQEAEPNSILKSAMVAATLDLPIDQNLGFAYIVPYKRKEKKGNEWIEHKEAQFQLGYKGFIQLAIRSGQYKNINVSELYDGQFISYDAITDTLEYDLSTKNSDEVTHYVAFFRTINGFEKYYIMSKEDVEKHAKTYSQAYTSKFSPWQNDFDGMAKKTVLKLLLSKFGILSIEMQTAQKVDQAVITEVEKDNISVEYTDNSENFEDAVVIPEGEASTNDEGKEIMADDIFYIK